MVKQNEEVLLCFICGAERENITIWNTADPELNASVFISIGTQMWLLNNARFQATCSDAKENSNSPSGISYVEYSIKFRSASNGYIGFSTANYTIYTEITYSVLPRTFTVSVTFNMQFSYCSKFLAYNLSLFHVHPEMDILQCELRTQEALPVVWPTSVYFIYRFSVNGVHLPSMVLFYVVIKNVISRLGRVNAEAGVAIEESWANSAQGAGQLHMPMPRLFLRALLAREPR